MQAVEFETTWKKIAEAMPSEKRDEWRGYAEDELVRVIVLTPPQTQPRATRDLLRDARERGYEDFLEYLMDYPPDIPQPIRFMRDELHER